MKIKFGTNDIVRGPELREEVKDLRVSGVQVVQVNGTLGGRHMGIVNRGNMKTTVQFGCERSHATKELATAYVLTHAESLNGLQSDFLIETKDQTYVLRNATLQSLDSTVKNHLTQHKYTFLGTKIET